MVILHWLNYNGEYKTFVSNRVSKIKGKCSAEWKCVPTKNDKVDLGSGGCEIFKLNNGRSVARNFLEGGSKPSEMSVIMVDQQRKFRFMERLKR